MNNLFDTPPSISTYTPPCIPVYESSSTAALEAREVYIKKLFMGFDTLVRLQTSAPTSKAAVIADLLDRSCSMIDSATDPQVCDPNILEKLKAICQEVSTACSLMQPELSTDISLSASHMAPQLPASMPRTVNAMAP